MFFEFGLAWLAFLGLELLIGYELIKRAIRDDTPHRHVWRHHPR
jgi:hypothetical protein